MAEQNFETTNYESAEDTIPTRYQRRGKRRKTTLAKREKQSIKLEMQDIAIDMRSNEEKYRISGDNSSESSVDENYEVDSIASSIEEHLT